MSNAGCASGSSAKAPDWDAKTGTFRVAGGAKAPSCKVSGNAVSYAEWDGSWNTQTTFQFKSNGSQQLNWSWKLKVAADTATPAFACKLNYKVALSECYSWGYVFMEIGYQVFDDTNFSQFTGGYTTLFYNSTGQENYSTCVGAGCSPLSSNGTFSPSASSSLSTTLTGSTVADMSGANAVANDSNTYDYYFTIIAIAIAYAYTVNAKVTSGSDVASAAINFGTGGNEFDLESFTIS